MNPPTPLLNRFTDAAEAFLARRAGPKRPADVLKELAPVPEPARSQLLAAEFEGDLTNGGLAQFLWNHCRFWRDVLDGAEAAYRAIGADEQAAALPTIRAMLAENEALCARRIELAKNEREPGEAFETWYADAEERMRLPEEDLFLIGEDGLNRRREAWLAANWPALETALA